MSILCTLSKGWLISHKNYIETVYSHTLDQTLNSFHKVSYCDELFKITKPYKRDHNLQITSVAVDALPKSPTTGPEDSQNASCISFFAKKKKRKISEVTHPAESQELDLVNSLYLTHLEEAKKHGFFVDSRPEIEIQDNNDEARKLSNSFYLESSKHSKSNFRGANNTGTPLLSYNGNEPYLFPFHSAFFCYNVSEIEDHMEQLQHSYDLILLDPPWWNKYIRRKKSKCLDGAYQMMSNDDLAKIPVGSLLAPGALVAVWCTNSANHINSVQTEIFPAWGVEYIGMWYWLKVTLFGEPVCPFTNPRGKQPFERIMFGHRRDENRIMPLPENGKMILSVPSAIHSHKPPLADRWLRLKDENRADNVIIIWIGRLADTADVLSAYLPVEPRCLELFARYLMPEWTSWGNEVLKLQHLTLYNKQPATKTELVS